MNEKEMTGGGKSSEARVGWLYLGLGGDFEGVRVEFASDVRVLVAGGLDPAIKKKGV